jgi:hypothetical protein
MKYNIQQWKNKCAIVHNNFYSYALWVDPTHIKSYNRVDIICPKHGTFRQILDNHSKGKGCPTCGQGNRSVSNTKYKEYYITKFRECHGDLYNYDLIPDYPKSGEKIPIACKHHGIFYQNTDSHYRKHGCPTCATTTRTATIKERYNVNSAIQRKIPPTSLVILNNKQQLTKLYHNHGSTITTASHLKVSTQTVATYLHKHNIDILANSTSTAEKELAKFCAQYTRVVNSDRTIIKPKELDIFLPDKNVAIEYCGLYWHSEQQGKDKWYHYNKLHNTSNQNIRLLTIFSDEWTNKKDIVKSTIRNIIGHNTQPTIYARNTNIQCVSTTAKKQFFDKHHIQGNGPSSINIGLYNNNQLVSCLSLIKHDNYNYTLNRYATSCRVVGGFTKLLKHFQRNYTWNRIITFADCRWSIGHLYDTTGWTKIKNIPPDYCYSFPGGIKRIHKFNFRRKQLPRLLSTFDNQLSERDNCDNNNILRIWDCGKIKYEMLNKNAT